MRKALILVNPNLASKIKTKEAIYQFTRLGASPFHASVRFIGLFSPKATRRSHISYVLGLESPKSPKPEKLNLKSYGFQTKRLNVFKNAFHQPGFLILTLNMIKVTSSSTSMLPIGLGLYVW